MAKPVCAVIGIGPGNGRSFARRFAHEGHAVALLSRRTSYSEQIAADLEGARAFACDVSDAASIASAFASIRESMGPVQTVIYNVGSGVFGAIDQLSLDDFEGAWRVNARGLFLVAKEVVGPMRAAGSGAILITGATASLRGKPFTTAFASAKAAQRSLAQSLARQLGSEGIHVALVIIDGMVDLPRSRERMPDMSDEEFMQPDDIAATFFHLATQPRSTWTFEVDLRPFGESW